MRDDFISADVSIRIPRSEFDDLMGDVESHLAVDIVNQTTIHMTYGSVKWEIRRAHPLWNQYRWEIRGKMHCASDLKKAEDAAQDLKRQMAKQIAIEMLTKSKITELKDALEGDPEHPGHQLFSLRFHGL